MRRRHGDRGAALIESALMFPVVALLFMGITDLGFAFRDSGLISRSANSAGRTISGLGDDRLADYSALRVIDSTLSDLDNARLVKVIIYDGDNPASLTNCQAVAVVDNVLPKGLPGQCSIYTQSQISQDNELIGFAGGVTCAAGSWDINFCPVGRSVNTTDPDRVGIYVEADFLEVTGILPFAVTLSHDVVYALEPCVVGSCG